MIIFLVRKLAKHLITLLILMHAIPVSAQEKGQVFGQIKDDKTQQPLEGATIKAMRWKDSVQIQSVTSKLAGRFQLTDIPLNDSVIIVVSYAGYETFSGLLKIDEKRFNMAPIRMRLFSKELEEVIVTGRKPLMIIRKDTIEFNVADYKTPPNSKARELMKRIPGLIVDEHGKLFFNGRPLTKVLVDGRPLFSENGAVALDNIPVEMMDKVQIVDAENEEEKLKSPEKPSMDKALNIQLKKGNKYFGNISASGGTDKRYDVHGLANNTHNGTRITVIGGTNNINSLAPSLSNPILMMMQAIPSGGGITKTFYSGLDYQKEWKGNKVLQGIYQFSRPVTSLESITSRTQQVLEDSSIFSSSVSESYNKSTDHSIDLNYNNNDAWSFKSNVGYKLIDNTSSRNSTTKGELGGLINALQSNYSSKGSDLSIRQSLSYKVPLKSTKNQLFFWLDLVKNVQDLEDRNHATTHFYNNSQSDSIVHIVQDIKKLNKSTDAVLHINYSRKLREKLGFSITNEIGNSSSNAERTTWGLDTNGEKAGIDSLYSNHFKSNAFVNSTLLTLDWRKNKWLVMGGVQVVQNYMDQRNLTDKSAITKYLVNVMPRLTLTNMSDVGFPNIVVHLEGSSRIPSLNELQPVQDNTNPLQIKVGNPGLKPEINYNLFVSGTKMFTGKSTLMLQYQASASPVFNRIASYLLYDSLGRQISGYRNVNGSYRTSASISGSYTRRFGKNTLTCALGPSVEYSHNKLYLNGLLTTNKSVTFSLTPSFNFAFSDVVELGLRYVPVLNNVQYDLNKSANQNYTTQAINANLDLYVFKRIKWKNSIMFNRNDQFSEDLDKTSLLWNSNISYVFLKTKKAEIKLTGFDLLKQNRNVSRTAGINYIEDNQSNNLLRYFMIGFTYDVSGIKKPVTPDAMMY